MNDVTDAEVLDIGELSAEQWVDYAIAQDWSDGLPLMMPTEDAVERFLVVARGINEPFPPITPRRLVPTLKSLAANAVMAGCKPEYFPAVLAGLRAVLIEDYNLHGTLATTHPCAPMMLISGPIRNEIGLNCGANCFGQGWRANAAIGRALQLILSNVGGAKPGITDRSTQGSPAKYTFCFGENEEESPWEPYHVRKGFARSDSVVTTMAAEPPHNINDHGSNSAEGILTTIAGTISEVGSNNIYGKGPFFVVLGPEHAATIHRDGLSIPDIQHELHERSRIPVSRVSNENREAYKDTRPIVDNHYYLAPTKDDIHVLVAGGPGKHSAFIPSFGMTAAPSVKITPGSK
jgi:hypothetical protein